MVWPHLKSQFVSKVTPRRWLWAALLINGFIGTTALAQQNPVMPDTTTTPSPSTSTPAPSTTKPAPDSTIPVPSTMTPNPAATTILPPAANGANNSPPGAVGMPAIAAEPAVPSIQKTVINPFVPGGVVYGRGAVITREEMLMLLDAREKKIKDELTKGNDLSKLSAALSGTAAANGTPAASVVGCFNGKAMLRDATTQQIRLAAADDAISKANHCQEGGE